MADLLLQQSQVNTVGAMIVAAGLDPHEFDWGTRLTRNIQAGPGGDPIRVSMLVHEPTGFFFAFDFDRKYQHHSFFSPGRDAPEERQFPGRWDHQLEHVRDWLGYVKREYEAPDLWAALQPGLSELPSAVENSPFTPEERTLIEEQLRMVLGEVRRTHELTNEQVLALEEKVDYLVEASKRLGRRDWLGILMGELVGMMLQGALASEVLRDLLGLTVRGLAQLFGGLDLPSLPAP
jgi:hypothetical protein